MVCLSGSRRGVDCTGLIFQALYGAGIDPASLGSHSYAYWSHQYSSRLLWADKSYLHVSYASRKRGDIIVYGSGGVVNHVGLYLGNNRIIDAMPGRGVGYNNTGAYGVIGVIRPLV